MHASANPIAPYLDQLPLIAILRGIKPSECIGIAEALVESGFRCIEVPLNSPDPLVSITQLVRQLPADCLVGAGTVLTQDALQQVADAGGRLIVMPHCAPALIERACQLKLVAVPGVATVSEAFVALQAGAHALKLFPAETVSPAVLAAWRTVLPADVRCLPVGGITPDRMGVYLSAGAGGFGLGSALYRAGMDAATVRHHAQQFVQAYRTAC